MEISYPSNNSLPRRLVQALWICGSLSLAIRLWIAFTFPITGDEAYFYQWGVYLDWGYYDHPPMVGWLISAMLYLFGDSTLAIRLPIIILPLALGALLWWALSAVDRVRAAWAVLFFWLVPLNWLNTLITTDTPLIFWSVCSIAAMVRAELRKDEDAKTLALYALSGIFLGCAFLSKYFSVVLGLCYVAYVLLHRRSRWKALLVLIACALPGPAINIIWNMANGWPNVMFNVFNRNQGEVFELRKPALYLLTYFYLLTPGVVWYVVKNINALGVVAKRWSILMYLVCVPFIFFALISLKKVVGLHWVLSFYPIIFAVIALALPMQTLKKCATAIGAFTVLHLAALVFLYSTSLPYWKSFKIYPEVVRSYRTQELLAQVEKEGAVIMGNAYTPSAIYAHTLKKYVPTFGVGKYHSRQDDVLIDFSAYNGKTIRVITFAKPDVSDYQDFFETTEILSFNQDGADFYVVHGTGFIFKNYKEKIINEIADRYYRIPLWLPLTDCPFCRRYCDAMRCTKPL